MSDLEDLWNSLPTGEPPTARILAHGRRGSSPWRSAKRPLIAFGAVAALGGAFVVGTLAGNAPEVPTHPAGPAPAPAPAVSPVAFHADLSPARSCSKLLATYVDRGLGQVTAWGWQPPYLGFERGLPSNALQGLFGTYNARAGTLDSAPFPASGKVPALETQRVTAGDTGTNVQEQGVDEPDAVKTDGHLLVRLRDDQLVTYDVTGRHVRRLSTLPLQGLDGGELLLSGDTVVAVGSDRESPRSDQTGARTGTRVETISLSDPGHPEVTGDVTYAAAAAAVYQLDDTVRMVLSTGLPDLPFVQPHKGLPVKSALAHNRRVVRESRIRDWLPGYDTGSGRQPLLQCGNVAVPPAKLGLDTTAVVTFAAGSPSAPAAFGLAGDTSIAYESADHLYLASTPAPYWNCIDCFAPAPTPGATGGTSYLFQFDLTDDRAVHVASGEVEGTIRDRWSLDESGGQLRVLVGPSSETGSFSSIVTLERRGTDLVETGRLDHLGPGEEIKSVRWQDDLALVVTYRQVDPLYVVDLRGRPRLLSALKVPGFSEYLNPLGSRRLIGVGSGPGDGGWGAQLGLFRTRDLAHVKQLDVWHYARNTSALAGSDPRAFTWLPQHRTVLTVIRQGRVGYLSIQHLAHERLQNRMVRVDYGADIDQVRTIGMPDGRVVLVTGDEVRFLRLGG